MNNLLTQLKPDQAALVQSIITEYELESASDNKQLQWQLEAHLDAGGYSPDTMLALRTLISELDTTDEDEQSSSESTWEIADKFLESKRVAGMQPRTVQLKTRDVIDSLLGFKKHRGVKQSTLDTYRKRFNQFEQAFSLLPDKTEPILAYLNQFNGETGRTKRNHHEIICMLYKHAVKELKLHSNPFEGVDRPIVRTRPIRTLSKEQVVALDATPNSPEERACLDLLLHGWRQIEIRRILAEDVGDIKGGLILCRGKERDEFAPILPETEQRLRELAQGKTKTQPIILASRTRRGKREPLGEDGMSQLIARLYKRAGITGMTGHDLRRTFATMVRHASGDEFLATRLIRDKVPGQSDRYINFPEDKLRDALLKYSPLRLIHKKKETGPMTQIGPAETSGGDGGESNSIVPNSSKIS